MRDSFVFYRSFIDALDGVDDATFRSILAAICEYALDGVEPSDLTGVARVIWVLVRPQLEANRKRAENGRKGAEYGRLGGAPKGNANAVGQNNPIGFEQTTPSGLSKQPHRGYRNNPIGVEQTTPNVNVNANVNANANENENACVCAQRPRRFAPPALEDIQSYITEKGYTVDAQRFLDYYQSNGWKVGRNPMKDWKAAVRSWAAKDRERAQPRAAPATGYEVGRTSFIGPQPGDEDFWNKKPDLSGLEII